MKLRDRAAWWSGPMTVQPSSFELLNVPSFLALYVAYTVCRRAYVMRPRRWNSATLSPRDQFKQTEHELNQWRVRHAKASVPESLLIGLLRNYADDVTDADYVVRM